MKTRHKYKGEYILCFVAYVVLAICQIVFVLLGADIFWTIMHCMCGVIFIYLAVKEAICFAKEKGLLEENKAKNRLLITLTVILVVLSVSILFAISIPVVNDITADAVRKELVGTELPEKTELIDSVSVAEKLVGNGNGNGLQYLGAILIESKLSMDKLKAYYAGYEIDKAMDFTLKMGLIFDVGMSNSENYYVVYDWGKGIEPFASLDLRGH